MVTEFQIAQCGGYCTWKHPWCPAGCYCDEALNICKPKIYESINDL